MLVGISSASPGLPPSQLPALANPPAIAHLQSDYTVLAKDIVQLAVDCMLGAILPAVKNTATRLILKTTRVYACTVDSTPGMVRKLEECNVGHYWCRPGAHASSTHNPPSLPCRLLAGALPACSACNPSRHSFW